MARAKKRRHVRNPPQGFKTWKAYMASIRPGGKRKRRAAVKRSHSTGAGTMAARKRRRRRNPSGAVANPPRKTYRRRHHRRRNPPFLGALTKHAAGTGPVGFAVRTVGNAVVGIGGEVFVRKIRGTVFKQAPGTIMGSGIEALLGLVGGFLLSMAHEGAGRAFAQGAVSAPLRTELQQLAIPHISDSLGDDGYIMGPGTGVTLISAFPGDYAGVATGEEGDRSLGRYVTGAPAADTMSGYVAGSING